MRHRKYWRISQTGSHSRCQLSTITCLTFSTMRAACILLCRLGSAAQEVRHSRPRQHAPRKLSTTVTSLMNEARSLHKHSDTSRDPHYAREGVESQQVSSWWFVHNKYPLWKGAFQEDHCGEFYVGCNFLFTSYVSRLLAWSNRVFLFRFHISILLYI